MLTPKEETEIADEEIDQMLKEEDGIVAEMVKDGSFIGDVMLPGPERLDQYWAMTPDLSDVPLLIDPDWELRIRHGLDRPPVNPYWKNLLREPGLLKSTSQDFVSLNQRFADRYEVADEVALNTSQESASFPAGGGLPLAPQATLSTPQSSAGGGASSNGSYQ